MKTYQEIQSTSYRWFDVMLMLLSCVAGSTDIISYYRLGHVFTANMTGNVILLGISTGQGELSTSLYRVASFAGFFAGVFVGALIVENKNKKKKWPYFAMVATVVESAIIATLAIIWLAHDGPLKIQFYILPFFDLPFRWAYKASLSGTLIFREWLPLL